MAQFKPNLTHADMQIIGLSLKIAVEQLTQKLTIAVAQYNAEQQAVQEVKEEPDNG